MLKFPYIAIAVIAISFQIFSVSLHASVLLELPKEEEGDVNDENYVDNLNTDLSLEDEYSAPPDLSSDGPVTKIIRSTEEEGTFGVEYERNVDITRKFVWKFNASLNVDSETQRNKNLDQFLFYRAFTEVDENATVQFPVEFEVRKFHRHQEWALPDRSKSKWGSRSSSKSLCLPQYEDDGTNLYAENSIIQVTVSTSSNQIIAFKLKVDLEQDNIIENFNSPKKVTISSSTPSYFRVISPLAFTSRYALLYVTSNDDSNHGCLSVSLQRPVCPTEDYESENYLRGTTQTMSKMAAITVKMDDLEHGRVLSLVMHQNNSECHFLNKNLRDILPISSIGENSSTTEKNTSHIFKTVQIVLREKITDEAYLFLILTISMSLVTFCFLFGIFYWKIFRVQPLIEETRDQIEHGSYSATQHHNSTSGPSRYYNYNDDNYELCCIFFLVRKRKGNELPTLHDSLIRFPKEIGKNSQRYVGMFLVVAAFYLLPVSQFVRHFQKAQNSPGNEDLCYFNYLCLNPFLMWKDFNHIFSNLAYIMLGTLFLLLVYLEDSARQSKSWEKPGNHDEYGIPAHFGLHYAMAAALMLEGVLSAMYHVCPNHLSIQFDMGFMYVVAAICLAKLYQARHPHTNASACITFGGLAVMFGLGIAATIVPATYLWIVTLTIHLVVTFRLSLQVYSSGDCRFDWEILKLRPSELPARLSSLWQPFRNFSWMTVTFLAMNVINCVVASLGVFLFFQFSDVGSYLLFTVLLNLGLYFVIYIINKLVHGERILWPTWVYILMAAPVWAVGVFAFRSWSVNWQFSPAESRKLNTECVLMKFFDFHDLWHFLSAFGIFFMFMTFFTLDDDLKRVKRTQIKVF